MQKPKPEVRNTNRLRLDIEPKLPNLMTIESQLQEAKGRRGTMVELPWQGYKTLQMWTLSVQWDLNAEKPIWTLYELYSGESTTHWATPYGQGELPVMYDLVCGTVNPSTKRVEPVADPSPSAVSPSTSQTNAAAIQPSPSEQFGQAAPPPGLASGTPPAPYPPMPYPPMPGYMPDPNMVMPMPYPPYDPNSMPPYPPLDPNQPMPPYGYPYAYPPQPGWPYGGVMPGQMPGQYPGGQMQGQYPPQNPYAMPASAPGFGGQNQSPNPPAPTAPPLFGFLPLEPIGDPQPAKLKTDYSLVSKRAKIQLGKLLLESTLVSEETLDAALKIQELVEEGLISVDIAPRALYGFHDKGQAIGEYLTDFESVKLPPPKPGSRNYRSPARPKTASELKPAYDLLQKAGIITEKDIVVAMGVKQKHGGELIQILEAANKLDKKTLDSAVLCLPLIREGLMRLEQCIIALNYCSRSRVDFDTALDEMNWPNPRKLRKDLPL